MTMGTTGGDAHALVLAKAPVAGRVKTRLGADVGAAVAADLAAASLLDTLRSATAAFGPGRCHLALEGDLADASRSAEILEALRGWDVVGQRGDGLGARIAAAHADVLPPAPGGADVQQTPRRTTVQIGMDTPQVGPQALLDAAAAVADGEHDAALGPAEDGGWWVLALRDPSRAEALADVPMSTETTHDDTRAALLDAGLAVAELPLGRDVDTVADADAVAVLAPDGEFARAWSQVRRPGEVVR